MSPPLDKAQELLDRIVSLGTANGIDLPGPDTDKRFVQYASPVITQPSLIVAVLGLGGLQNFDATAQIRVAPAQTVQLIATIARDYVVADQRGADIPEARDAMLPVMDLDGDLLWDAIWSLEGYVGPSNVSIAFTIMGGIAITSGAVTVGTWNAP